eukprot:scaffold324559_cov67-Tisochrysis_lutea.AAC.3
MAALGSSSQRQTKDNGGTTIGRRMSTVEAGVRVRTYRLLITEDVLGLIAVDRGRLGFDEPTSAPGLQCSAYKLYGRFAAP